MIKKILFGRQLCLTFAVLGAVMAILPASAVEPIPTFDVIVTPALLTKSGNPAVVTNEYDLPGAIRDRFYNIYERFWKEQSYYSVNPTTGRPANGVWMRPYVKGYVHVPWPMAKAMDTNNLPSWMWQYPCDYTKFDYDGELPYTGVARHRREENWEVPPRGAPPGTLGQLFVDTNQAPANPLLDGVWTPGEAFYDANSNGVYDLGRVAEDRWWADNKLPILFRTNWPGIPKINDYNSTNAGTTNWDSRRGEIYVDYNSNTLVDSQGRIQTVGFDPAVEIWIQSGTNPYMNARVTVSEFNFTPHLVESNGPAYHGDFYHTYVPGHPGDQADIPTNRLFDFNVNLMTGRNLVYRALDRNGNPILLTYQMWVVVSNGLPYEGTNALTDNALLTDVKVPAYQASELFGAFYSAVGNLRSYTDTIAPYVTNRLFTNGVSGVWDDEVPTEPFEDFLSWWVPDRGTGMAGGWSYLDVPGAVVRSDYLNELTGRASRTDRIEPLTWDDYEDYITLNYQGNVASLLARATNGVYDGPDNWNELTNYMYQWSGYISVLEAKTPLNTGHWYFGAYGDFDTWRLAYWPLATNAMTWFPADQIPNIVEYDPGDSKTNANCVEYGKIIGTKAYVPGGGWKPCLNMGWSYDNVIEFCDMPSSLYHSAGEGRLGEITSPWSHSLYGQNVVADPFDASDKTILLGGPRATGVFGDNGRDAGNLLSLEVYTWGKPEYRGATDGNLNGMIDQGESRIGYPSYSCDDDSITVNGADSLYPFNYKYLIEDVMEIWDWFTVGGITGSFYNFTCYPTIVDNPRGVKGRTTGLGKCSFTSVSRTGGTAGGGCQVMVTAGMQGLSHEQGHYCFGFPDFYDVDSKDGAVLINYPMAGYTIMEGGAKWVHDCPYDKNGVGWISDQPLAQDGWGNASRGILVENGGPVTLELYPMEANRNAYFYFNRIGSYYDDPSGKAAQRLWIWYSDASSMFSYLKPQDNNGNSFNGIYMMTVDTTFPIRGFQLGTLINAKMVQASGKDELVAGVQRGVSREDMFPGTTDNRSYSADTLPSARWQDGHDMGFRVNDFVLPSKTGDPAQVTLEWYDPRKPWPVPWWGSDKNSNSIPDLWEFHWFSGLGTATATSDFDLDRLPDWAEWLSNTDPRSPGSYEQDADNDGLNNGEETIRFKTNPLLADTDDDGVNDRLDLTNSWPTNALSPAVDRVLSLDGQTNSYVLMPGSQGRFKLNDWTIMAWVKPSANCNNGLIISRDAGNNNFNYCLGLTNGPKPFVKFSASPSSNEVRVLSSANLPLNRWSHIAGVFDSESGELSLYVDGNRVAYTVTGDRPAWNMDVSQQPGWSGQKVGQGFAGWIDEVGIFNQALARNEIEDMKSGIFWQTNALVAYYRFDDGTSATNNNGTWSGTSGRGDW
ncbi:MAG: LamG-like jellyroll fold domain-containing protein, partial [Kiritimatiellia bacterium]|nr:LamG-like jellyroll fold domain-containing protein [Kiritimatiellia bacterium]